MITLMYIKDSRMAKSIVSFYFEIVSSAPWRRLGLAALLLGLIVTSCKKENKTFPNPYAGGREPLGISLSTDPPTPDKGGLGSTVTFKAKGLLAYKDSMTFYLNGVEASVVSVDSNQVKIKVPENGSTGVGSVIVGDEIFFGPIFRVQGKLAIDNNFKATVGANGSVNTVFPLDDGRLIYVGSFTDFNHKGAVKPLNRIVMTSKDGEVDRNLLSGTAVDGYLNTIDALPNKKFVIGGGFSSYDSHLGQIKNITLLNSNGSLDTMIVRTFLDRDTVPAFNGGVDGRITKLFVHNNTITAVGSFTYYLQFVYGLSDFRQMYDSLAVDSVEVRNMVRFFPDGSLDSSFNYDFDRHRSFTGPNGPIVDAFMQEDGKLIIVGRFSKYNGDGVSNICRINPDGSLDRTFRIGSGADNTIGSIRFNETTHKFMIAGAFDHFNGVARSGLAMLNADGTLDPDFNPAPRAIGEAYRSAHELSNGMVVVSGFFKSYDGVHRAGFMILDNKGKLAPGYNTAGDFNGFISDVMETKNSSGQTLITLMGSFRKFDEVDVGNITRLVFTE